MARTTVQRRSRDGLLEIVPTYVEPTRAERYAVIFEVLLLTTGLYLTTLIPPQLLLLVLGCCVVAELGYVLDPSLLRPKATVFALQPGLLRRRPDPR